MARRKKDEDMDNIGDIQDMDQDGVSKKKRKIPIIPLVLILVIVGGLTAILGFNVFNIRDQYILPPLRGLPLVGNLIPAEEVHLVYMDGEYVEIPAETASIDPSELEALVTALTTELEETQEALRIARELNAQYEASVQRLQTIDAEIEEHRENQRQFNEMIALGDPPAFATFFETVNPEDAARLFTQIRTAQQADREFRNYARTYAEMNTDEAAAVFAILLTTNPNLLLDILGTFNNAQRAEVFNEMEASDVAIITTLMAPDAVVADILPPVPVIAGGEAIPVATVADVPVEDTEEPEAEEDTEEA